MKKKILAFILAAAMLLSLSACAKDTPQNPGTEANAAPAQTENNPSAETPDTQEPVEITFWHSYSEGEEKIFTESVLTAFEQQYPNIKVNAIRMPYEGLDEQLITAVTGDAAPDVIRLDLTWVSQMAKLGALECLNDYAEFDDISAGIMPGSMSTTLYKGQNYGLPLNANTTVAVYNNAVLQEYGFDAPPETLDALMGALDKTDPAEEKWLFAVSGSYNWAMLPFIWTLGGSVTDGDYTTASGYLNGADTVKALDTIVGWYKDGVIGPAIMGEQPDGWGGIEAGNYTMIVEGPWFFSSEDKLDTYTPALMPSVDGRSISIVGGEDIVMTSTSSKKDAAWTFMKFMLEDAQQVAMAGAGMIPVTSSAMEKVEQYQNISGLVGQAPLDYTADNLDDAELENPVTEALREFWLKHRLIILLTLAVLLAAGMVGLLVGWLIFERRRTKKRKEGFFGADAAASIDAIFRYMMDVLRARGMAAKNCPPADYVSYMDEDLREEYLTAARLWQEARFSGKPMEELQRRQVLRLKDEIWERTWHSASLKERLRLKYVEFL